MTQTQKKILAIIPARGGSVGLPDKNIANFCGKPLISYTIQAAKESGIFDRVVVSTDSKAIVDAGRSYGADVPYLRPPELATATANVADAVLHMLDHLRTTEGYSPESFFLLQPTSPLREAKDIQDSFELFTRTRALALTSVCKTPYEVFHIKDERLVLTNPSEREFTNRQERPDTYRQDGGIYILNTTYFLEHKTFAPRGMTAYITPQWKAVDIDDEEDFKLAEVLYMNKSSFHPNGL